MMRRPQALVLLAVLLVPARAGAIETEQFGVEPHPLFSGGEPRRAFELALGPGGTASESVRVWNKTKGPITLLIYGAGVEVTGQGHEVAAYEDRGRGAGAWVRPAATEVRLGPKASQVVTFDVVAPAVLPESERLAAVVVEGDTGVDSQGVDVFARLALLVRIERSGGLLWGVSWLLVLAAALAASVAAAHLVRARAAGRREPAR